MRKHPAVLLTGLYSSGIILSKIITVPLIILYTILSIIILLSIFNYFYHSEVAKLLLSYALYAGIIIVGNIYCIPQSISPLNELNKEKLTLFGTVTDIKLSSNDKTQFTLRSDSLSGNTYTLHYSGSYYCSFIGKKINIFPGNRLMLKGTFVRGRDTRNPGEFDYSQYLRKTGTEGFFYIYNKENLVITDSSKDPIRTYIYNFRKGIAERTEKYFNKETAGLVNGLILGERSDIDRETKENFVNSGTAHVLAVSGLNVGYVVLIFLICFGRVNLYIRSLFTAIGIIMYVFISGGSPSIIRASLMAIVFIISFVTNRSDNIINSLSISALIILIIDPAEIFLPAFQLSYAAVLATALIYPVLKKEIEYFNIKGSYLNKILLLSSVTIAAQLGTLPFVLYYFSKLSLTSIIANLVVIPLIGIILGAASAALIFSLIYPPVAYLIGSSADLLNSLLNNFIKLTGSPSFSFVNINSFTLTDALILFSVMSFFLIFIGKMNKVFSKLLLTLLSAFVLLVLCSLDDKDLLKEGVLSCYMIDVGQGDAFLLKFPSGKTALIDAGQATRGYDNGERVIKPLLNQFGIEALDYSFISHLDNDHYSGFIHLIDEGFIHNLYKPYPDTSEREVNFEKLLRRNNVKTNYYSGGKLSIDSVRIYFLEADEVIRNSWTGNNKSAVFLVCYGSTSFLFTGDAGTEAENFYINKYGELLKTDVLKISHHGSASATSEKFLYITRPSIALVSTGEKNIFGHPSDKVIDKLRKNNISIHRTDRQGGILLESDGIEVRKINWKEN